MYNISGSVCQKKLTCLAKCKQLVFLYMWLSIAFCDEHLVNPWPSSWYPCKRRWQRGFFFLVHPLASAPCVSGGDRCSAHEEQRGWLAGWLAGWSSKRTTAKSNEKMKSPKCCSLAGVLGIEQKNTREASSSLGRGKGEGGALNKCLVFVVLFPPLSGSKTTKGRLSVVLVRLVSVAHLGHLTRALPSPPSHLVSWC